MLTNIPEDLEVLNRRQLQTLAKKHGIPANSKSETIKTNLKNYTIKSKLTGVTRLDTQLTRDLQDLVFQKVYDMANPEIEAKIKYILDRKYYPGDDYIVYNYSKIRKKLNIKHNFKPEDLKDKVENFKHKYVRLGVIYYYFEIKEIIDYFDFIDGENEYARKEEDFDSYFRKLRPTEAKLRTAIKNYNNAAKNLKEFDSYINVKYINRINKFINNFRKVAKIPYLIFGTQGNISSIEGKKTRKIKSLNDLSKNNSKLNKTKSRYTRSI